MKKKIAVFLILMLFVAIIGGCSSQTGKEPAQPAAEEVTVNIAALAGPTVIGMVKMFEDKPGMGENVTANYQLEKAPDVVASKIVSGEIDMATVPTNLAAQLYNKGVPYSIAAMNTWGVVYILGNGVEVNSWHDLKGKTVHLTGKGSSPDVVFRYLSKKNGLDPEKDLTINYLGEHTELAQLMIAGKVDLGSVPEPFVTNVLGQNKDVQVVLDIQEEWKKVHGSDIAFAQACLIVKKDLAEKHPQMVKKFLEEYAKSIAWANGNPAEAGVLAEKHNIGMKAKAVEAAIPRCNIRYMDAAEARPAIEKYLQVLFEFSPQSIGGKLPDDGFYYKK